MKKLTLIILAAALATTAANADDYYFCFTGSNNHLNFAKIPGPGTYDGLDIVDSFPIADNSSALTYDGENWWMYENGEIYCFDRNGDYVSSFPRPNQGYGVLGLAWDGDYLWIANRIDLYQRDIYGNPGPYGFIDIDSYPTECVAVKDDRIIIGNYSVEGLFQCDLDIYDFDGNYLFTAFSRDAAFYHEDEGFSALAAHDGMIWLSYFYIDYDESYSLNYIYGFQYQEGPNWSIVTTIENISVGDLTICDADFINIAEASLGKIKAYFAEEESSE